MTGHRTADVVVVGAGLAGLTAARPSTRTSAAGTSTCATAGGSCSPGRSRRCPRPRSRTCKWHNGTESKLFAVYDRPFWREQGLSGMALTDRPVAGFVIDNSPPDGAVSEGKRVAQRVAREL